MIASSRNSRLISRASAHLQNPLVLIEGLIFGPEILVDGLVWSAKFIDIGLSLGGSWQLHMTIDTKGAHLHTLSLQGCIAQPVCT